MIIFWQDRALRRRIRQLAVIFPLKEIPVDEDCTLDELNDLELISLLYQRGRAAGATDDQIRSWIEKERRKIK